MTDERQPESSLAATIGVVVTRFVVPAWLILGAVLKLIALSPSHLPSLVVKTVGGAGVDLVFVARFAVAVELVVAVVMLLLPRLARPVGLAMLGVFVPILIAEVVAGSSSCGCFGAITVPPVVTLAMDLSLFLIVLLLGRKADSLRWGPTLPSGRTVIAGLLVLASFALAFGVPAPKPATDEQTTGNGETALDGSAVQATAPAVPDYYLPEYDQWLGRPWSEIDLAAFMDPLPAEASSGPFYILFYRTTCEHCHELLELYFTGPLTVPTLAVSVPEKTGFASEGLLPFPCDECLMSELPVGCDWFLTTPVLVRLYDGVVECAAEVDAGNPECYQW